VFFHFQRRQDCAGLAALAFNAAFNAALLGLFVQFYRQAYKKRPKRS